MIRRLLRNKWLTWPLALLLAYTVIGFLVIPAVIKWQMLERLPALTHRAAAVRQVLFNPYSLALTIRDVALTETNGDTFASFAEFHMRFAWSSAVRRAFVFEEIRLAQPFAHIVYAADGTFNFANLASTNPPAPPTASPHRLPRVIIDKLAIDDGAVAFTDCTRQPAYRARLTPINVHLTNLTTLPQEDSPYAIAATFDSGTMFAWSGDLRINPLESTGTFKLTGLTLTNFTPYLRDFVRFELVSGRLDAQADYRYDSTAAALDLEIKKAGAELTNLQLKAPATGETILAVPSVLIRNAEANVSRQMARVASITVSGGTAVARLDKSGALNWLDLLRPATPRPTNTISVATAAPATTKSNAVPWQVSLDEFRIADFAVNAEDRTPATPVKIALSQLNLSLKNISLATNAPIALALAVRCNETGRIAVAGSLLPFAPSADLKICIAYLAVPVVQPYLADKVRVALTNGALAVTGSVHFAIANKKPALEFTGDVALTKFNAIDIVRHEELAKWDALNVSGIKFSLEPKQLDVCEIKFSNLAANLAVLSNHELNVATLVVQSNAAPSAAVTKTAGQKTPAPAAETFPAKLDTLVFDNASFHFADQSITPAVATAIDEFTGTIKGLTTTGQITADVNLHGKIDNHAPFNAVGQVTPSVSNLFLDLTVALQNMALTPESPYAGKFAGYALAKGRLTLDLKYHVKDKALSAQNKVRIDQLRFGAKSNSPDATKLPVKLAVALLQDRHGVIDLDLPVSGRLDDPKFRLAPIILQVFMNVITKAVTKPFALIGALVGGGEGLSTLNFVPGTAEFAPGETNKLTALATALYERPALALAITGEADPVKDRDAIARTRFEQRLKTRFFNQLSPRARKNLTPETVQLAPADRDLMIKAEYLEKFGTLALPETGKASAPAPGPKVNFTVRLERETPGAKSKPGATSVVAQMESKLVALTAVTPDDFRKLIQDRVNQVSTTLLATGKVTADRLEPAAPPAGPTVATGQPRVTLALD